MKKPRSTPAAPTPAASSKPSPFQAFLAGGAEPITVTLSGPTSALVRWYCATTKHREEATADGVVFGALTRAKDTYEDDSGDEAFNFVLEDVLDCMNSFRVEYGPGGRQQRVIQLDEQATGVVLRYAHQTDSDPRDVVNAAVLAEVPHVLDQLTKGDEVDDGPGVMREQVAAARRRRTGEEAAEAPVALSRLPEEEPGPTTGLSEPPASPPVAAARTVTLELSAQAVAMLDLLTVHDGHASPEETIRATLASGFTCLAEYLGKDGEPFVSDAFGVGPEGEEEKA